MKRIIIILAIVFVVLIVIYFAIPSGTSEIVDKGKDILSSGVKSGSGSGGSGSSKPKPSTPSYDTDEIDADRRTYLTKLAARLLTNLSQPYATNTQIGLFNQYMTELMTISNTELKFVSQTYKAISKPASIMCYDISTTKLSESLFDTKKTSVLNRLNAVGEK